MTERRLPASATTRFASIIWSSRPPAARGSALLTVLMVALILLLLTTALVPSAQTEESAGRNAMVQEQLRMGAVSVPMLQSVRLTTNNDHRGGEMMFDATPPGPVTGPDPIQRLPLRDTLEMNPPELVSDLPCDLCGINNDDIYGNNVPGRNVFYALDVCSRRTAEGRDRELGRYCLATELNLLPWKHDGAAQAAAQDKVTF